MDSCRPGPVEPAQEAPSESELISDDDNKKNRKKKSERLSKRRYTTTTASVEETPTKGSFAHESMRAQFNVSLPDSCLIGGATEPKRKVALLLAYRGTRYSGFQANPLQHTLQAEIELALYKAGVLSRLNFGYPYKYGWSNSARTDKGVHACAQVCSAKLAIGDGPTDDVRQRLNAQLPNDVCVLDVVKTSRNFCAKRHRYSARYQYMFPSFLLCNRNELHRLIEAILGPNPQKERRRGRAPLTKAELDQLRPTLVKFRATSMQLKLLSDVLRDFQGTHSFHNFTNRKTADHPSVSRYVKSFDTADPVVLKNGVEWIITRVVGQSFLLHQIRKMISLAVDIVRGSASPEILPYALEESTKIHVSLAPAQGLFLEMSFYDGYNRRIQQNNIPVCPLDWSSDDSTPAAQRWKRFKEDVVLKHIVEEEQRDGNFIQYLFLQEYLFDFDTLYKIVRK